MGWVFTAHGLAEDAGIVEELLADLRQVFAKGHYQTSYTSLSGPGGGESGFHSPGPGVQVPATPAPTAPDPVAETPEPAPAATDTGAEAGQETPVPEEATG